MRSHFDLTECRGDVFRNIADVDLECCASGCFFAPDGIVEIEGGGAVDGDALDLRTGEIGGWLGCVAF